MLLLLRHPTRIAYFNAAVLVLLARIDADSNPRPHHRHRLGPRDPTTQPYAGSSPGPAMPVPIAVGVLVGVAASFIQSLGLTLQRLSHLSNEQRSTPDWQRPLWLTGLAIFLLSNVTGTLFQISTLPLVVLGPLGAVSLVCNALFAHLLLGDAFSLQLAFGSALIAAGATLVGIFGAVPEQSHTLPQLVALYQRPPFLAWLALLAVALALVLTLSHLVEWRLARTLASLPAAPKSPRSSANRRHRLTARTRTRRRWSLPNSSLRRPSDATTGAESSGGGEREPLLGPRAHQNQTCSSSSSSKRTRFSDRIDPIRPRALRLPPPPSTVNPPQSASTVKDDDDEGGNNGEQSSAPAAAAAAVDGILAAAERTRLWLAIAYGATSGTLSGLCLLFTKTGMDLVIQTLVHRNNQVCFISRVFTPSLTEREGLNVDFSGYDTYAVWAFRSVGALDRLARMRTHTGTVPHSAFPVSYQRHVS